MRGWWLILVAACGSTIEPEPAAGDTGLPDPLASEDFAFCHEEGADADQVARWCGLLERAPPEVCPGMRATCASGNFDAVASLSCDGDLGTGVDGSFGTDPDDVEAPWRARQGCDDTPEVDTAGWQVLLRWLVALAAASLVLVIVLRLMQWLGWVRPPAPRQRPVARVEAAGPVAIEGDDDLPALPEEDLLALARQALSADRFGEAAVYARGAALRRLARRGLLSLHRARTDREYLQRVRRDPEIREALSAVLRAVEDHRWAGRVLTAARAEAAVAAAVRILAVLLLAVWALPTDALGGVRRHGPRGDAAVHRLFEDAGYERARDGGWLADVDDTVHLVVIDLFGVKPLPEDWAHLLDWVDAGGLLLIGGDPHRASGEGVPELFDFGVHDLYTGKGQGLTTRGPLKQLGLDAPVWPDGPTWQWCHGLVQPLVVVPRGGERASALADLDCPVPVVVALTQHGEGAIVALSDPMLLRNGAMMLAENRRFLVELWPRGAEAGLWSLPEQPRVLLATISQGSEPASPFARAANARMLPFVLHLGLLWLLVALWRGWPLIPLRDPPDPGRHDFADHVDALARQWSATKATRYAGAAYAGLELERHGGVRGLRLALVRGGMTESEAHDLAERVDALAADPQGPDGPDDRELVEELWTRIERSRA